MTVTVHARCIAASLVLLLLGGVAPTASGSSPAPASPAASMLCGPASKPDATRAAPPDATRAAPPDATRAAAGKDIPPTVSVAAAADLRYAMADLIAAFEASHAGESVQVTYGSSGNFFAQISQGAPFDVYFSADVEHPRALEDAGLAEPGSTRLYAEGRIVTWVRDDSPIDVEKHGLGAVTDAAAERVAIANPAHAPYGRAAQAALEASGLWDQVQPRLVLGENVGQAAQFVESGAADIGVLALSLAIAPPLCHDGRSVLVPAELHPPILQGALVLADATQPDAAGAFLDFVLGLRGREVLDGYGFLLPEP